MDPQNVWAALSGPTGTIAALALVLIAIVKWRFLVPGWSLEREEQKRELLEGENSELNKSVMQLASQNAGLKAEMKALAKEVEGLHSELERLKKEVGLH